MKQIEITVSDKVARLVDENTIIICDNSDYVAVFDFDSEWDAYDVKTARFKWNGKYEEKVFTGTQCAIPVINDTSCVYIGVYAGNLSTTTGVRVPTQKSILCGSPVHNEPDPDVYNQILALLESMEGVSEEEIAAAVEKYLTENPLGGVTSVNDKTGTVTLGASDVGAIPVPETATVGQTIVVTAVDESGKPTEWKAADMPSGGAVDIPTELPNPYALTFTGAVTASYDGSEAVTVEIPSGGGSSGESAFRLINTVNITEEVSTITIDKDSDGNAFEISEVLIYFDATTYATASGTFYFRPLGKAAYNMSCYGFINTTAGSNYRRLIYAKHIANGFWRAEFVLNTAHNLPLYTQPGETITSFQLLGQTLAAGNIYVYGR